MQTNYFDWHNTKAKLYTSSQQMNSLLKHPPIAGKRIQQIHILGFAYNMQRHVYLQQARQILGKAGIPLDYTDAQDNPCLNRVRLPCQVKICEPVVFVFEDNSTLEILPSGRSGLLISTNQIPPSALDGTNFHNFDSTELFGRIVGSHFVKAKRVEIQTTKKSDDASWEDRQTDLILNFSCPKPSVSFSNPPGAAGLSSV